MSNIDLDAIAPIYTVDGVEITKGMDLYFVHYGSKIECRKVIALSKVNRYFIMVNEDGDELKHRLTDNERLYVYSTKEKVERHQQNALLKHIEDQRESLRSLKARIAEKEQQYKKKEDELNLDKHFEAIVLGIKE